MTDPSHKQNRNRTLYRATPEGIAKAKRVLKRFGIDTQDKFAKSIFMSRSTLLKFFNGKGIQLDSFQRICEKLSLNWQDVADVQIDESLESVDILDLKSFILDEDKENRTLARRIIIRDRAGKNIVKAIITLEGDLESAPNTKIFESILQEYSGDSIEITDTESGSIKLFLEGSLEDIEKLVLLIRSGELSKLGEFPIQNIQILSKILDNMEDPEKLSDKWHLVKEIIEIPILGRELQNIDLSDVDLSGAILRNADLSGAILTDTDLTGADLSGAILRNADLSGAILTDTNLTGADLSGAILTDTDLTDDDLTGIDLIDWSSSSSFSKNIQESGSLAVQNVNNIVTPTVQDEHIISVLGENNNINIFNILVLDKNFSLNNIWNSVKKWMQINPDDLDRIGEYKLLFIKNRVVEYAQYDFLTQRIMEIETLTRQSRKFNTYLSRYIPGIVAIFAAMIYGSFLKNDSSYFSSIALITGGIIAGLSNIITTDSLTDYLKKTFYKETKIQLLERKEAMLFNHQGVRPSELTYIYWNTKIQLLMELEELRYTERLPLNTIMAIILNIFQCIFLFAILDQTSLISESSILLKLTMPILPIILNLAVSLIQSQMFYLPGEYLKLRDKYISKINTVFPLKNLNEEHENNWYKKRLFEDERFNVGLQALLNNNYQSLSPELAELKFDIEYYQALVDLYEEEKDKEVQKLDLLNIKEMENIIIDSELKNSEFKNSEFKHYYMTQGYLHEAWLENQRKNLKYQFDKNLEKVRWIWDERINRYKNLVAESQITYQQELEAWKKRTFSNTI